MRIIFFGSTADSLLILEKLWRLPAGRQVIAVVTQPPKPVGRTHVLTPTPVETWAKKRHISVSYRPPTLPADLLVSASYGEKIPIERIRSARFGGLNVHPSLLPRWRGGDPVPWAILQGDTDIGVTVVTLSEKFDQGEIIAQTTIPITATDVAPLLRMKLFRIGADLLVAAVKERHFHGDPQNARRQPYAKRLTRDDGFEPWEHIVDPKEAVRINRKFRAFHPWPGLWSTLNGKRIKILNFTDSPVTVQLEGKKPVPFTQFKSAHLPS